jgi:dihydrofolate synthase / folylpolyglutamate synthase
MVNCSMAGIPITDSSTGEDYPRVADYLFSLKAGGVKFGIDRMARLAEALGHPERLYPVVHVAGTNGKGSVSALLESIFRHAGWRTGLYTSPHLVKLGERVQVDRRILTEGEIVAYTAELRPVAEKLALAGPDEHPSFFEFMTAMAFLQFARKRVDVAVVEVGLGGRLDATNVVLPEVAVISSIGLDHLEQLGDNVAKIAREKAGIIKPGRPLVLGRVPAEAEQAIREIARARGAPVHSVRETYGEDLANYPRCALAGDYQRWNAATATLTARVFARGWNAASGRVQSASGRHAPPDEANIARGLAAASWPGRWQETTLGGRRLILDASHNPEGAQVLENNLHKLVAATGRAPIIVTGVLGEFRARALLDVVCRYGREVHLLPPHIERASTHEQLESYAPPEHRAKLHRATLEQVFPDACTCALGGPDDTIVVTGSIYLLGEILARIEPGRGAGEARLQDF